MGLSYYRCHDQLSRTCTPSLSCDYISQLHSSKGKLTPTAVLLHTVKLLLSKMYTAQKRYAVHHNTLLDSFRIG